jgi:hypothetical protein
MPSPSHPRTRLELLAAAVLGGAAALGTAVFVWGPQQLPSLPDLQQLRLPWTTGTTARGDDGAASLPLVLTRQGNGGHSSGPISVPPPVIPQILPPGPEAAQDLAVLSPPQPFKDLPPTHWVYPMVSALLNRELVTGFPDGSFRPDQPMTRAEFASQLARTFALSPIRGIQAFNDVTGDNWAAKDITTAMQMGFLTGYPDAMFFPDQTIDRIQVLTALAQGLNLKSSSGSRVLVRYYQDYEQVPDWAIRPLIAATEAGLVVNHPDPEQLNPNRPASRAEVTAMLYRALVYIGHLEDVSSPHWVQPEPVPY